MFRTLVCPALNGTGSGTRFEFVKLADTTVYDYMGMAVSASAASTEEALSFSLQLAKASGAFADVSEFTVCPSPATHATWTGSKAGDLIRSV